MFFLKKLSGIVTVHRRFLFLLVLSRCTGETISSHFCGKRRYTCEGGKGWPGCDRPQKAKTRFKKKALDVDECHLLMVQKSENTTWDVLKTLQQKMEKILGYWLVLPGCLNHQQVTSLYETCVAEGRTKQRKMKIKAIGTLRNLDRWPVFCGFQVASLLAHVLGQKIHKNQGIIWRTWNFQQVLSSPMSTQDEFWNPSLSLGKNATLNRQRQRCGKNANPMVVSWSPGVEVLLFPGCSLSSSTSLLLGTPVQHTLEQPN